jgi:phytoene synthase
MQDAFAHCEQLVREHDKDRFLATLFAPAEQRRYLLALYAFALEVARVKYLVHDPMAGMIRLQWWHDAISGSRDGEAAAHPVASALLTTISTRGLSAEFLLRVVEARQEELQGEPADGAEVAILSAASALLGADNISATLTESAGRAMTRVREPVDADAAREAYADFYVQSELLPAAARPAFLPVALVPLLVRQPEAAQWRKQIALLRAAWFGFPKPTR